MPTIQVAREIAAPAAALFALAQDYGQRLAWDPFLRGLRFLDGARAAAPGVRVAVQAHNGLRMEVRYTVVRPPEQVAVVMERGPRVFRSFAGAWIFRAIEGGRTRVAFRYHFRLPALLLPLGPLVGAILRREMRRRLAGLAAGVGPR